MLANLFGKGFFLTSWQRFELPEITTWNLFLSLLYSIAGAEAKILPVSLLYNSYSVAMLRFPSTHMYLPIFGVHIHYIFMHLSFMQ